MHPPKNDAARPAEPNPPLRLRFDRGHRQESGAAPPRPHFRPPPAGPPNDGPREA